TTSSCVKVPAPQAVNGNTAATMNVINRALVIVYNPTEFAAVHIRIELTQHGGDPSRDPANSRAPPESRSATSRRDATQIRRPAG
ncbi:MAG TPA: hypothetical protein VF711_11090, partial [Acidimicrobiales bacterium]